MRPMCLSLSAVLLAALSSPATAQTPLLQPDTRATSTLDQYLASATSRQELRPSLLDRAIRDGDETQTSACATTIGGPHVRASPLATSHVGM